MHVHKNKAGKKEETAGKKKRENREGFAFAASPPPPSLFPDRTVKEKREKNMTNKRA